MISLKFGIAAGLFASLTGFVYQNINPNKHFKEETLYVKIAYVSLLLLLVVLLEYLRFQTFIKALQMLNTGLATTTAFASNILVTVS